MLEHYYHFHFTQTDSTNSVARRWLNSGVLSPHHPTVITADRQTRGRGTKGRSWASSDSDGLYFTMLLPRYTPGTNTVIQAATATQKTISQLTSLTPQIEWPNDLVYNNRKLAGILLEQVGPAIIIGIGLNINQVSFPKALDSIAISLFQATGNRYSKIAFTLALSKELLNEMSRS